MLIFLSLPRIVSYLIIFSDGSISGTGTFTNEGTLTLSGTLLKILDLGRTFINRGAASWTAGPFHFRSGSKFSNADRATFDISFTPAAFYDMFVNTPTPTNTFENNGTVTVCLCLSFPLLSSQTYINDGLLILCCFSSPLLSSPLLFSSIDI